MLLYTYAVLYSIDMQSSIVNSKSTCNKTKIYPKIEIKKQRQRQNTKIKEQKTKQKKIQKKNK